MVVNTQINSSPLSSVDNPTPWKHCTPLVVTNTLRLWGTDVLCSGEFPPDSHSPPQALRPAHSEGQGQTGSGMYDCKLACCRRILGSSDMSELRHNMVINIKLSRFLTPSFNITNTVIYSLTYFHSRWLM